MMVGCILMFHPSPTMVAFGLDVRGKEDCICLRPRNMKSLKVWSSTGYLASNCETKPEFKLSSFINYVALRVS
jgi:hypothetical protein